MFKSLLATVACFTFISAQSAKTSTTATSSAPTEEQKKLALASEAYCTSTAATKITPAQIADKVKEACTLIDKEGIKAFTRFQGDKSAFIFGGTYLVINDFAGIMLMHPMKPEMNGKNFLELKDKNGKLFYAEMVKLCKDKGDGWVDFFWPKAGATEPSQKVSYVHKAKCDGKEVVVSCGVYDMTLADVEKALAKK